MLLRRCLRVYDAQPFVWAMLLSNLAIFALGYQWVMDSPLLAVPVLAFIALWCSLISGSLLEFLRYRLIKWLHGRGVPPDSDMYLTHPHEERKV